VNSKKELIASMSEVVCIQITPHKFYGDEAIETSKLDA
jgi:hypothetical protein